jgi:hypothetical protein
MELLPIDYSNVMNSSFWDAIGRRSAERSKSA